MEDWFNLIMINLWFLTSINCEGNGTKDEPSMKTFFDGIIELQVLHEANVGKKHEIKKKT